ncbi:ABC transporter substrate-binding protein [Motiliproteus sp. SC1-56]|uniref:cytochrome c/ABC transporter substrate-binding protein n=1 Tax=Motiliproteus sp. SC1-56 TaxID=2799565 RepID=UPI001A90C439|nr:ABC transporter substrate-binding protein [Motiliproteus sp. SC1-56]
MVTETADRRWLLKALSALLLVLLPGLAWSELTEQQARGQKLYLSGISARGNPVEAYVGGQSVRLPGSVVPCASCHGEDGRGRPEGGVIPSDITWPRLTKAYGVTSTSNRRHPPYDETALSVAIVEGGDPAGNRLDSAMPRYAMATEDMADLVAYLKVVGQTIDPGMSADSIQLGLLIPAPAAPDSLGGVIKAVYEAYFADINGAGGIYNRKLQLVTESAAAEGEVVAAAERLARRPVFALLGAVTGGQGAAVGALMESLKVPSIGPLGDYAGEADSLDRYSFYLLAGTGVQQRSLVDYAAATAKRADAAAAILHPRTAAGEKLAALMASQAALHHWTAIERIGYDPRDSDPRMLVKALRDKNVETLFFIEPAERAPELAWTGLAAAAREQGWAPAMFLSGPLAGHGIPDRPSGFGGELFFAYPTLPRDLSPEGLREFQQFHRRHGLSGRHLQLQISAYATAKLLARALKTSGRNLSREKLVAVLEDVYQYQNGLTPPLTFGPNRRLGADGAYVVGVDTDSGRFSSANWVAPLR